MIIRSWRGSTSIDDADRYYEYLRRTGIKEYRESPGNQGVYVLRRRIGGRAEFLLLSLWDSMDSVREFAGPHPERAVFYPEDDEFLVERDDHVDHYEILMNPE